MLLQENKQYSTSFNFEFTDNEYKTVDCHLFILNGNICIVSFVEGERFVKAIYSKDKELISFDNYKNNTITLNHKGIDRFTSFVGQAVKENCKINPLDKSLIEKFNLITEPFAINRNELRFSLDKNTEFSISKFVEFKSNYANQLTPKGYLKLRLLKVDGVNFHYCISDYKDTSICKFTFQLEELVGKDIFNLIGRVNYIEEAKLIDFTILNKEFNDLNSTSQEMYKDYANEEVSFSDACHYSILSKVFNSRNIKPILLSI